MGIRIVTDSTSEISQAEAAKLGIDVVPLRTLFGDVAYRDGIEITPADFYARLAASKVLPTTSQPAPADFLEIYRQARKAGDEVVTICLARLLSGTCQSAELAREACGDDGIWIVDSNTATVSLQLLVRLAISLRDSQVPAAGIVEALEREKSRVHLLAAIDTLEYLHRGGRLSRASAVTGTLLNVKPLISLAEGTISVVGKSLGRNKAHAAVLKLVQALGGIDYGRPFAIGYTGSRGHFGAFEERCRRFFKETDKGGGTADIDGGAQEPIVTQVGSVVGTHAGPGAVAIAFFSKS